MVLEHQSGTLEYLAQHFLLPLHALEQHFPKEYYLCKMSSQRRAEQLTTQESCILYIFFWKFIMYINILKTLRRIAVNITSFKPNKFDISQLISTWNLLSSSSSSAVTLNILRNIWEMFPLIQQTIHIVLILSLRLERPFSSFLFFLSTFFPPSPI